MVANGLYSSSSWYTVELISDDMDDTKGESKQSSRVGEWHLAVAGLRGGELVGAAPLPAEDKVAAGVAAVEEDGAARRGPASSSSNGDGGRRDAHGENLRHVAAVPGQVAVREQLLLRRGVAVAGGCRHVLYSRSSQQKMGFFFSWAKWVFGLRCEEDLEAIDLGSFYFRGRALLGALLSHQPWTAGGYPIPISKPLPTHFA